MFRGKVIGLLLALVATVLSVPAAEAMPTSGFRNPVLENGADPQMVSHGGAYYLTYTRNDYIAVTKAASVTELATAPEVVVWRDDTPSRCCYIWAPEMHFLQGKWYIYYTATNSGHAVADHRMYVLESANPLGPYTFKGALAAASDHYSLDGTVLTMPDGRLYAIWSGWEPGTERPQNLYIAPMSNPWTTSGPRVLLSHPEHPWEMEHLSVNEGAAVLWRNGRLFLAFSASGCTSPNYAIGLLTFHGGDVLDPAAWTKSPEPHFKASPANNAYGTAHNSFFTSPDGSETWIAYHAVTNPNGSCGGDRSTRVQRVEWRADGTPIFGVPVATSTTLRLPSGDPGASRLPNGDYVFRASHSGKALDVAEASTQDNADVVQWLHHGNPNQVWRLRSLPDGTYELRARHSNKLLTVGSSGDVVQRRFLPGAAQRWHIDAVAGGFRISAKAGGHALSVDGAQLHDGANVLASHYLYIPSQKWQITLRQNFSGACSSTSTATRSC
ncbi:family 43 glycosylhydrolase [Allokutzneria albata]|uniref:Beta-xylosidase, GH43 family n=1 Tax=Allokutzneria albata TaxID=211114 RepID=A0A1G9RU91_ALLAB|nr:family 43 glycosylhydrolase [Allokutzneria albata]SDM26796.1 Beta-xylosidase, GH43 family [Allokutzneria albata]